MTFQLPTLADLLDRTRKAFRASLPGTDAWLWPNNIWPTAKVIAGSAFEVFQFADYIQRQKFALTADGENLDLHGAEFGIPRKPAAPAAGAVTVTVVGALTVSAGAVFLRGDGIGYIATQDGSLAGDGSLEVPVIAATDGKAANSIAGTALDIASGVVGTATAEVSTATPIVGGADVEPDGEPFAADLSTYRGRILFRKRNPPAGGNPADYVRWAASVSGVTRVFIERRWNGAGTVRIFVMMDDLYPDGIPQVADIARVQDYIDTQAPATAIATVAAPTAVPVNVTITGLSPNTVPVQEAIKSELRATFRRLSVPAGADTANAAMPYLAVPGSFAEAWVWRACADAAGVTRDKVTSPTDDIALTAGQIATLGTVTFG